MSSQPSPLHVAIIGGGLGGLALATALKRRSISFTVYESRGSFTEIGAGINLGPNGMSALRLIDAAMGERIYDLASRAPLPDGDIWMRLRYGAADGEHEDGETFGEIIAPGTGSTTLHRQEFLTALAEGIGEENTRFGMKFADYEHRADEQFVRIKFANGEEERASVLVACDGIHSRVRVSMFGENELVSRPHFNHDGAYRAVIPMDKAIEALGEQAGQSQALLGPGGGIVYYPVSGGAAANCGLWVGKPGPWQHEEWVVQNQGEAFRQDTKGWGPRVQRLLQHFDPSPAFWAAHQHTNQPERFVDGRVILMGDGAHAMPPHQGAGSSQAVEDAYVLSETLALIKGDSSFKAVAAALQATMSVRQPRFEMVHKLSVDAGPEWFHFYEQHLEGDAREAWVDRLKSRLGKIWNVDMSVEAKRAAERLQALLTHT